MIRATMQQRRSMIFCSSIHSLTMSSSSSATSTSSATSMSSSSMAKDKMKTTMMTMMMVERKRQHRYHCVLRLMHRWSSAKTFNLAASRSTITVCSARYVSMQTPDSRRVKNVFVIRTPGSRAKNAVRFTKARRVLGVFMVTRHRVRNIARKGKYRHDQSIRLSVIKRG